jgi:acyl-CoA synthetase (AMP-forming)/AMP-acid ligase II
MTRPSAIRRDAVASGALAHDPAGVISFWAAADPDLVAIRWGRDVLTYGELDRRVSDLADAMTSAGAGPGHRVAIVGENEPDVVSSIFAAWRAGAWAVPLNARYTAREIRTIIGHADPYLVVVVGDAQARHARTFKLGEATSEPAMVRRPDASPEPVHASPAERTVLMLYTSGTTGAPKGVMLPSRALAFMASLWAHRPVTAGDRIYQALPISHSYGLCSYLFGALNIGCDIELTSRFDPEELRRAFAEGLALFQGVPAMYARYLQHLAETGTTHRAPALKAISTGGAPLDPALKARVEAEFGISLRQAFGLTEAGPTVTIPDSAPQPATALGHPAPGAEVRLVEPDGEITDGPAEMWVRTPGVMKGYFRDEMATAAVLTPDGWLKTGDIVQRAADGVLHIVGRSKDVIIRSGFNIYPAEVEAVLLSHPSVLHAAVVGRPIDGSDESVVAFIELASGASAGVEELLAHAARDLAGYKRPCELYILDRLPMGLSGKVATAELKAQAATPGAAGRTAQ